MLGGHVRMPVPIPEDKHFALHVEQHSESKKLDLQDISCFNCLVINVYHLQKRTRRTPSTAQ